jgi:alkanesulfonate monooxygenase SsuD/methylene tetrahydromethanopterin reductase-like flavin-dependent oxidoreductase (luciferase family)
MHIGVSERSGYGAADVRTGARWMVERVRAARDAGMESLFLGEHHSTGSTYYQNAPMLGRLLAEWGTDPLARSSCCRCGTRSCWPNRSAPSPQ